jgi:hypothetical protein
MAEAGVIPGTATEVIWDLKKYQEENQQLPLGPGNYRLTIWDERGESAIPGPGLMRQFGGLKFGMYTPNSYVPLDSTLFVFFCTDEKRFFYKKKFLY